MTRIKYMIANSFKQTNVCPFVFVASHITLVFSTGGGKPQWRLLTPVWSCLLPGAARVAACEISSFELIFFKLFFILFESIYLDYCIYTSSLYIPNFIFIFLCMLNVPVWDKLWTWIWICCCPFVSSWYAAVSSRCNRISVFVCRLILINHNW